MFRNFSLIFSLLIAIGIPAQNSEIDSLKTVLSIEQNQDSLYVTRLLSLSYLYRTSDLDSAQSYIEEALNLSLILKDKRQEGMSRMYLAQNYKRQAKFPEGLEQILIAKHLLDSLNAPREQQLIVKSELATFYEATKDYEKALEISLQTLSLVKNDPLSPSKGRFYYDVGNRYMKLKQYKNAEKYYLEAIDICDKTNFLPGKMIMMGSLATAYKNMKQYKKAIMLLENALPYFEKMDQKTNIAASYQQLGQIASLQGDHKASVPYYEKARRIFNEVGNLEYSKNISQTLFVAYSILQNQEKATAANEIYISLRDSIESRERMELVADMKTKYETDKIAAQKEAAEIKASLAEIENKQNKNYLIGAIIIGVLILLASLFFIGRLKATKKAELITVELRETQKRLAIEKQYKDSELKALKSQMNPHFIFNALNSIQEYIMFNKKELASDYLGKFADLIRTYLQHSDTGLISIQEEIDSLKMYLDLECLRFEDSLEYTFNVSEKINKDGLHIPTMLIQPYIENAIKHGLLHKKEGRKLIVSFLTTGNKSVQCIVEDNGVGREKAKELKAKRKTLHKSFATKATQSRLELLNYRKDEKIGVEIIDLLDENQQAIGTKVILNIPTT